MIELYRISYINNFTKFPTVIYDYGECIEDVISKVLERSKAISNVKIKRIKEKADLLDAASEINKSPH